MAWVSWRPMIGMRLKTKYARERETLTRVVRKASSTLGEHRRSLSLATSVAGLAGLAWVMAQHGGWHAWQQVGLASPWALALAVALWPANMGLEVAKWSILKAHHVPTTGNASPWREVLVGQTAALLAPTRLADGAGRLMAWQTDQRHGAVAFGWGAAAQGWATWTMAVPALVIAGLPWPAVALGVACALAARLSFRTHAHRTVAGLSLMRFAVFALQCLACLVAFGALMPGDALVDGYPRIAAMWCALASIPWPVELGAREWMATLAFDERLPSVVMGMLALWLINRAFSAFAGWACFVQDSFKWRHV